VAGNLIVLFFEEEYQAEGMLEALMNMQERGLIVVEDAVLAERGVSEKINIKQTKSVKGKFTLRGGGAGLLAGLLLGGPIGGLIAGATVGAIAGSMKDFGIDDDQIKEITKALAPNSSALFLLIQKVAAENIDDVLDELRVFKAHVVQTSLPADAEEKLQEVLAKEEYRKPGD